MLRGDVLVVGGGPAGTLVASSLARTGASIIQLVNPAQPPERPFEVLAPATRRLLAQYGLTEPAWRTEPCRGVLSYWGESQPTFHDYKLSTCFSGLTVDRIAFHESLIACSEAAGVRMLRSAKIVQEQHPWQPDKALEILVDRQSILIGAGLLIDATGRNGSPCAPKHIRREYFNRLVALSTPFKALQWQDCLIVEAAPEGWWYLPPSIEGKTQLVFLTDADILPRGPNERRVWLSRQYNSTRVIADTATNTPSFHQLQGTDARFSRISTPVDGQWVAVGDTALALDPLSGTGTFTALTSAAQIVETIRHQQKVGMDYTEWWNHATEYEKFMSSDVYEQAANRFPSSIFWNRRTRVNNPQIKTP